MKSRKQHKKLKILMLIPELGYGGAEKSFLKLASLLSEYHDVKIAVFQRHYAKGDYAKADDDLTLPVIILDYEDSSGRFNRWKNRWKNLKKLKNESDITISFLTGANILNASVFTKSKTIVSIRGSRQFDPNLSKVSKLIYEYILDPLTYVLSDKVVSISKGLSHEIGLHVGAGTKEKIVTIELFVNAKKMIENCKKAVEKEYECFNKQPLIISAGRLSREKGFLSLLTIFSKVLIDKPNAKLMIIGDGPQKNELMKHCNSLNITYRINVGDIDFVSVFFIGYKENPCRYFKFANCFVLSSLTEGFSNVLLEALASGVPIISVNSPWGPRSILSKDFEDFSEPYPTKTITQTDFGCLMPRIDLLEYTEEWKRCILGHLEQSKYQENILLQNQKRLFDFDEKNIKYKWLKLIDEVVG